MEITQNHFHQHRRSFLVAPSGAGELPSLNNKNQRPCSKMLLTPIIRTQNLKKMVAMPKHNYGSANQSPLMSRQLNLVKTMDQRRQNFPTTTNHSPSRLNHYLPRLKRDEQIYGNSSLARLAGSTQSGSTCVLE